MPKPIRPPSTKKRAEPLETIDGSQPEVKSHYIGDWMDHKEITVPDMAEELDVSLSQVYRWLKGQKPHRDTFVRIAALLEAEPPEALLRHPLDGWATRFFKGRSEEEAKTIIEMMERAWPPHPTEEQ